MSYDEAVLNQLYFEHASVSSEYCERNSFSTLNALANWQTRYQPTKAETFGVVRSEMNRRGLQKSEQEEVLAKAVETHRSSARKHNVNKPPQCKRFDLQLKMYSDLLVR